MGLFLMLAGVAESNVEEVESVLQNFAHEHSGVFTPLDVEAKEDDDVLTIAVSEKGHLTILYPNSITNWDEVSQSLSVMLKKPVFSLHIHDSDLWMYILFANGKKVDCFNPIPDYWEEDISETEIAVWSGNAAMVCRHWPEVSESQIANYLVPWNLDDDEDYEIKAYPDDEYGHEDWQMVDFMKKIGLTFPLDETGNLIGKKYHFKFKMNAK